MSTEQEIKTEQQVTEGLDTQAVEANKLLEAGDLLREKRELLGLSQKDVADRLRLRVSIIQSIDANNYDFDQVSTFTRGYLRSYAKAVSLDEKTVLDAFHYVDTKKPIEQQMQSFSRKAKREKHDSYLMKITWLIAIVILGISSVWWYQSQQDTLTETSSESSINILESELATETALVAEPSSPVDSVESEALVEAASSTEPEATTEQTVEASLSQESNDQQTPITEADAQASSVEISAAAQESKAEEQEIVITEEGGQPVESLANALLMSFSDDCWIQIKDASGKTLTTGVQKAGKTIQLAGQVPYQVILGAPKGVKMTFAGEPVDLSSYNSGKVARFSLPLE
jgi:cytoskeleton protein RodZ